MSRQAQEKLPEFKLVGESWLWALFQAGVAWMAWEMAGELEGLDHPHLAGVYRKYAREMARYARPFLEELARAGMGQLLYRRIMEILRGGTEESPKTNPSSDDHESP